MCGAFICISLCMHACACVLICVQVCIAAEWLFLVCLRAQVHVGKYLCICQHLDACAHMYFRADLRSLRSLRRRCCVTLWRHVGTCWCQIEAKLKPHGRQVGATSDTKRHTDWLWNFLDFGLDFGAKLEPKIDQNGSKIEPSRGQVGVFQHILRHLEKWHEKCTDSGPKWSQVGSKIDAKLVQNRSKIGLKIHHIFELIFRSIFDPTWVQLGSKNGTNLSSKSCPRRCRRA